jgi:16S rRNA (uracil1498-N3)-methyltransferase
MCARRRYNSDVPAPRFFVPTATPESRDVGLDDDEAHHARHVLRLGVGADVRVFDGRGHEWSGRVAAVSRHEVRLSLDHAVAPVAEPGVAVTLGIGALKGDQMDAVVRDATMLGVASIVPLFTDHVAVAKHRHGPASTARWQRVAVASAKQCQRAVVPEIAAMTPLAEVLARGTARVIMCAEPQISGAEAMSVIGARVSPTLLLVGPEGGWSVDEIRAGTDAGAVFVHLGPRTLRAETAPCVALTALWTIWGW